MTIRTGLALFVAGAIAAAAVATAAAEALAQARPATATDLSAQTDNKKKQKGTQQKGAQQKPAHQNVQRSGGQTGHQQTMQRFKKSTVTKPAGTKSSQGGARKLTAPAGSDSKSSAPKSARVVTLKGPRVVTAQRLRGLSASGAGRSTIRGRNFSTWRGGGYRVRHGNAWVTFVPLAVLSAILIGEASYYPYAYISAPADYCEGLTEDGCQLMWDDVQTVEGDIVGQCVAYCPWQD